jgi:hypothetical protein
MKAAGAFQPLSTLSGKTFLINYVSESKHSVANVKKHVTMQIVVTKAIL